VFAAMSFRGSFDVDSGRVRRVFSKNNVDATSKVVTPLGSIPTGCYFEAHLLEDLIASGSASVVSMSNSTEHRLRSTTNQLKDGTLLCFQVAGIKIKRHAG
jgi:hypothetical protein